MKRKRRKGKEKGRTRSSEWAPYLLTLAEDGPFTGSEEINEDEMEKRRGRRRGKREEQEGLKGVEWKGKGIGR